VGIEPTIATSKKEITTFLRGLATGDPTAVTRLTRGWRAKLLGDLLPASAQASARVAKRGDDAGDEAAPADQTPADAPGAE